MIEMVVCFPPCGLGLLSSRDIHARLYLTRGIACLSRDVETLLRQYYKVMFAPS